MNPEFVAILQKLITEQGKETLLNAAKCKSFLSDYTRNEYKRESRLLLLSLDAGIQKAIDTTGNIAVCKKQRIRQLHDEYDLDEKVAADVVDMLALVLRGDIPHRENDTPSKEIKSNAVEYLTRGRRLVDEGQYNAARKDINGQQIMVKTVKTVDLNGKRVIMRVDFNVPMKDGVVQDDTRIVAAIPTIKYILAHGVKTLTLMSHLGEPSKDVERAKAKAEKDGKAFDLDKYIKGKHRMWPIANYLQKKLGKKATVVFAGEDGCYNKKAFIESQKPGTVIMLENTRFHKEETSSDAKERDKLAKALAEYGDIFVNDAFSTAHKDHASTVSIAKFVHVSVAGFLMEKEVHYLEPIVNNPVKPMVAIIGGALVSPKIAVLENFLKNASTIVIGGGMAYTLLKAQGKKIGKSIVEDDQIDTAKKILETAKNKGIEIVLPVDHVGAEKFDSTAKPVAVTLVNVPDRLIAMDVGPKTLALYKKVISTAKTIVWNGPVGVFEFDTFARGTEEVAKMVAAATEKGVITIVGGGDSVAAVNKYNLASKMSHVSTGGFAFLELLEGKKIPGIEVTRCRD